MRFSFEGLSNLFFSKKKYQFCPTNNNNRNMEPVHQRDMFCVWIKLISLHIRSMWETTVMHKQVSGCTVNFGSNFPESPFLESQTRKPPLPQFWKTLDLGWPKFTLEYPPNFGKLQIWDDQSLLWNTPPFGKLQIWDDQSLLQNTPSFRKLQIWNDQSFLRNTPPHFGKLQIWDDQSFLQNTSPFWKTSDLGWPKFTLEYPLPHFGKLQIWDDQSLLWNTPPPNIVENFRFGMTKVYSGIPPPPRV